MTEEKVVGRVHLLTMRNGGKIVDDGDQIGVVSLNAYVIWIVILKHENHPDIGTLVDRAH